MGLKTCLPEMIRASVELKCAINKLDILVNKGIKLTKPCLFRQILTIHSSHGNILLIVTIHLSHRSKFIEVNKDLHLSTHRAEVRH
jgi:hypothetical protein